MTSKQHIANGSVERREKYIFSRHLYPLSRGLVGADAEQALFRPAVVTSTDGERRLAYLVEDHGDGNATVLFPRPPTAFAGDLLIVPRERVALLKAGLGEVSAVISHWGLGLRGLLETARLQESE